ncbi:MAG: DNA polymerase IV [Acidimicrobiales bacterium]|nr:DNA polymerase IV [Acidimicrobiales bacterium]MDG1845820.1 DNA polymerase IV [Acidimicrobiales bacterium]
MTAHILHVDMDAFFVSAELVRRPELRGSPVLVGGTGNRGVVAAASYEARAYGIFSAMSTFQARRLCPEAIFLEGDHAYYGRVSSMIMEIFDRYTPLVEPISLDEAFLDVGGSKRLHGTPFEIAQSIRRDIKHEQGLTCSVGIAPNKFLAKLATEGAKPKPGPKGPVPGLGIKIVEEYEIQMFLDPLPVSALWGVGPATVTRLSQIGITTVLQLRSFPRASLIKALGKTQGSHLYRLAHGVDERNVEASQVIKSLSHEETFPEDLFDVDRIGTEIFRMSDAVGKRLRGIGFFGSTVNLKVRLKDFSTFNRSVTLANPTDSGKVIGRNALSLLETVDVAEGVRLLGVGMSNLAKSSQGLQLSFDEIGGDEPEWREAERAIDLIHERYGSQSIGAASTLTEKGLRPKEKGSQQWGPSDSLKK